MTTTNVFQTTSSHRARGLKKGLATFGALAMLAVGGFGALSSAEAQSVGVKEGNYVLTTAAQAVHTGFVDATRQKE